MSTSLEKTFGGVFQIPLGRREYLLNIETEANVYLTVREYRTTLISLSRTVYFPLGISMPVIRLGELSNVEELISQVKKSDKVGAIVLFLGVVRKEERAGENVVALVYEAHKITEELLSKLANTLKEKYELEEIIIEHAVGRVNVSDITVQIAASAKYRTQAFGAVMEAIEHLKSTIPIWKKEVLSDGREVWIREKAKGPVKVIVDGKPIEVGEDLYDEIISLLKSKGVKLEGEPTIEVRISSNIEEKVLGH